MRNIQVADPNDPRLTLGAARDLARWQLAKLQQECGCQGGATCAVCAPLASEAARLAVRYQNLYAPVLLIENPRWWRLPIAEWAFKGDADETER